MNYLSLRRAFSFLYLSIFLFFLVPYLIYLVKLSEVKYDFSLRERRNLAGIELAKAAAKKRLEKDFPETKWVLQETFDFPVKRTLHDTLVKFFIYQNHVKLWKQELGDIAYLEDKTRANSQNQREKKKLEKNLDDLERNLGKNVRTWASKVDERKFFETKKVGRHQDNYPTLEERRFNPKAIRELDLFMQEVDKNEASLEKNEALNRAEYQMVVRKLRSELSEYQWNEFQQLLKKNPAIYDVSKQFVFHSDELGTIRYQLPTKIYDNRSLQDALDIIYEREYAGNSLETGSMPYSYCYGASNMGRSFVKVNSGDLDVIVLIKDQNNVVIRHAYIKARDQFTLNLPNGEYNIHFYFGTGWNPNKHQTYTSCGELTGGFVYFNVFDKDPERAYLYDQGLTYTLQTTRNGNFSTVPSNAEQTF